ncbi:MAG TPA: methyltransferase domain-containing protein [Rhizomicrobium sp.]
MPFPAASRADRSGGDLARAVRLYHDGAIDLAEARLEWRFFGASRCPLEEPIGAALARLGVHKFEEDAGRYDVIRAALRLLPRSGLTLLDIGSGSGRLMLYAACLGARRVHGIEILAPRAAFARAAAAAHGLSEVAVMRGDALRLAWPKTDALIAMNPFYPSAYPLLRERLIDHARAHDPAIVAASTLRDSLAADPAFNLVAEAAVGWIKLGAFALRRVRQRRRPG